MWKWLLVVLVACGDMSVPVEVEPDAGMLDAAPGPDTQFDFFGESCTQYGGLDVISLCHDERGWCVDEDEPRCRPMCKARNSKPYCGDGRVLYSERGGCVCVPY